MESSDSPLEFSWNPIGINDPLKVRVTAVVDPVSEGTQRVAPLLRAIRDQLELPLRDITMYGEYFRSMEELFEWLGW